MMKAITGLYACIGDILYKWNRKRNLWIPLKKGLKDAR